MFDLEQAITDWRQQMLAAGIKAPAPLDELENHLREEVENQIKSGSHAQSGFETAIQKIGSSHVLDTEFGKIGAGNWDRNRKLPGKIAAVICLPLLGFIVWLSALTFSRSGMSVVQQILALAAVLLTLLAASRWRYALKFLPVVSNTPVRLAMGIGLQILGICSFSAFANIIEPWVMKYDEHVGLVVLFWAFLPLAVVVCLGLGVAMSERDRRFLEVDEAVRGETASAAS